MIKFKLFKQIKYCLRNRAHFNRKGVAVTCDIVICLTVSLITLFSFLFRQCLHYKHPSLFSENRQHSLSMRLISGSCARKCFCLLSQSCGDNEWGMGCDTCSNISVATCGGPQRVWLVKHQRVMLRRQRHIQNENECVVNINKNFTGLKSESP